MTGGKRSASPPPSARLVGRVGSSDAQVVLVENSRVDWVSRATRRACSTQLREPTYYYYCAGGCAGPGAAAASVYGGGGRRRRGAIAGGASTGAMWGGTGMMVHPAVGAIAGAMGLIYGAFDGFKDKTAEVADTVDGLTKKMDELSKRDERTSETFVRIAEAIDKINKAGGSERFSKIQEQRGELTSFVKEEYGDEKLYSGVFKGIR